MITNKQEFYPEKLQSLSPYIIVQNMFVSNKRHLLYFHICINVSFYIIVLLNTFIKAKHVGKRNEKNKWSHKIRKEKEEG